MAYANRPPSYNPPIVVVYDKHGKRAQKRFEDAQTGRAFFIAKYKAGKNPIVLRTN